MLDGGTGDRCEFLEGLACSVSLAALLHLAPGRKRQLLGGFRDSTYTNHHTVDTQLILVHHTRPAAPRPAAIVLRSLLPTTADRLSLFQLFFVALRERRKPQRQDENRDVLFLQQAGVS